MKLIVATNNINKIREIKNVLNDESFEILSLDDINFHDDIIEDGQSFLENAKIKASTISKIYRDYYVIADDSGLEISALNNEPGIYSARYSGLGDYENNLKVLKNLKDITNRSANFTTCISLYYNNVELNHYFGIWEGNISQEISGDGGFGYDPIFIPNGYEKTVASLDHRIKDENSHRALALKLFAKDFLSNKFKI